ncbi:hypothetical protein [uncultured Legionella sp.]|uniref:hypothetical protein n=1 Tax=uncultured Legionella sp. TaxID=210934 RepID=UPI00261B158F|nr:hypothetical protein [uncultured Legionella sp.]
MINQINPNIHNENKKITNECAIMTLTPTVELFPRLRELSEDLLAITNDELNPFLDEECLTSHTVPICIPLITNFDDLDQFISNNSALLIDFMLAAWPIPLEQWGFIHKNRELLDRLIKVTYYPILCKAIAKPVSSTLDLAVTFATPTNELIDYIANGIHSKKMNLNDKEFLQMEFILSSGVAVITNQIEKSAAQNTVEFYQAINDSKNYLTELKDKIVNTLFYFYFRNNEDAPQEIGNEYLKQWFNTKTYLGMYMFPDEPINY